MELAQIDPLRIEVFAPVAMLGQVSVGMRGRVTLEAPLSSAHDAGMVVVDRVVDAASGMFGIRLELPNADHALPGGLKCSVEFEAAGDAAAGSPTQPAVDASVAQRAAGE